MGKTVSGTPHAVNIIGKQRRRHVIIIILYMKLAIGRTTVWKTEKLNVNYNDIVCVQWSRRSGAILETMCMVNQMKKMIAMLLLQIGAVCYKLLFCASYII